jgi:hypothetical protein
MSKSKSREEERQQEEDLIAPEQFNSVMPFDYSKYLSTYKSPVIPVIDYKQPIREAEKRDYDKLEQNRWEDAPLRSPSEKSPSKKRPRYSAKGRKGRKGGTRKSSNANRRNTKKTTRK